ncbi:MAG TPA: hypothetical protein DC064_07645, partial [Cyanobacteria bacterium UBA9273]|nr:hypothetical protein [Cyanobacteria bacterium UBA9273]
IVQTIVIPILNDSEVESDETIKLTLSNPSNGATIGINNTTLTILDNDSIIGVDPNSVNPGLGETDILTGGGNKDKFILGDANQVYYNDGNDADLGLGDYALITDFQLGQDSIQLHGTESNYILGISPGGLPSGVAIFYQTSDQNELIGIVDGVSGLSLDSDAFTFVS